MFTARKCILVLVNAYALLLLLSCSALPSEQQSLEQPTQPAARRPQQRSGQPTSTRPPERQADQPPPTRAPVAARECSLYAAPAGQENNDGEERSSPTDIRSAARRATPGDVVCLLPGRYNLDGPLYISTGGIPTADITYRSYDNAKRALIVWTDSTSDDMFQVNSGAGYISIEGLMFDGKDNASAAIKCSRDSHHIRVIDNIIDNAGQGGVATVGCDYITVDGNKIYHTGYGKGWGSGISLNKSIWYDRAAGFHSFVVNNIISGSYDNSDHHSDGNGIIMDLGGRTPPVLIANNLIYQNGGRCIHILENTDKWIINNTCYQNNLDSELREIIGAGAGEYSVIESSRVYLINNAAYAWSAGYSFKQEDSDRVSYYHNTYYGGDGLLGVPTAASDDRSQLQETEPLFRSPAQPETNAERPYNKALRPEQVGDRFHPSADSPLIDAGIDPRSIPGLSPELRAGIEQYVLTDLDGAPRPQGNGFDIGAYESGDQKSGTAELVLAFVQRLRMQGLR